MAGYEQYLVTAVQVAQAKGLLLHELLSRLGAIQREFGGDAARLELALQMALMREEAEVERERRKEYERKVKRS